MSNSHYYYKLTWKDYHIHGLYEPEQVTIFQFEQNAINYADKIARKLEYIGENDVLNLGMDSGDMLCFEIKGKVEITIEPYMFGDYILLGDDERV